MTADRDQHGLTADDIAQRLAEPSDEPRERLDPPAPATWDEVVAAANAKQTAAYQLPVAHLN